MEAPEKFGTASGRPVAENEHSNSTAPRGTLPLQNHPLPEKMGHVDREDIQERVVHANGPGTYGTFTVTQDISQYTRAKLFSPVGKQTKVFARFWTVGGENGSADTEHAPRGFAVTFYTEDGDWNLVGHNMPVFSMKDHRKLGDLHTQKHDSYPNGHSATRQWEYRSLNPESVHQVMLLLSDRGTPFGYRHMNGYGSHPFSFVNADGERFWVKFHVKTAQGIKNVTANEAADMKIKDPDFAQRDLREAIDKGEFPRWNLKIQVMPEADAKTYRHDPFDLTKIWPHGDYPLIDVGTMELNQTPDKYVADVEQPAFALAHVVDGIGFLPDGGNGQSTADVRENDHYSQPGDLYRNVMTVQQRRALIAAIVSSMSGIDGPKRDNIINLQLCHWFRVDLTLGVAVAQGLGLNMESLKSAMMQHA